MKPIKNKKRRDPRYFLNEGTVVTKGYVLGVTSDYKDVTVLLDGAPLPIVQIYDDLNTEHPEYQGWKENVPQEGWDNFMSEQLYTAIEDWAEMRGHQYEAPDSY